MKKQTIEKQLVSVKKSLENFSKICKKAEKKFHNLKSKIVIYYEPTSNPLDIDCLEFSKLPYEKPSIQEEFTYTLAELSLPKVNINDFIYKNASLYIPILDLHINNKFTSLNNSFTILKTNHNKRLFGGETASFSWELTVLLLSLPEQTEIKFIKNDIGQYDIYLPILGMIFSNVDEESHSKLQNRLNTVYNSLDQNELKKYLTHKSLLDVPKSDKNLDYFKIEFKLGEHSFKTYGLDKDHNIINTEIQTLDNYEKSKVDGYYGLNKAVFGYLNDYFGLNKFDKIKMNLYFTDVIAHEKNSHHLKFYIFESGDKQALAMPIYLK
jgi:hypothetical protein